MQWPGVFLRTLPAQVWKKLMVGKKVLAGPPWGAKWQLDPASTLKTRGKEPKSSRVDIFQEGFFAGHFHAGWAKMHLWFSVIFRDFPWISWLTQNVLPEPYQQSESNWPLRMEPGWKDKRHFSEEKPKKPKNLQLVCILENTSDSIMVQFCHWRPEWRKAPTK